MILAPGGRGKPKALAAAATTADVHPGVRSGTPDGSARTARRHGTGPDVPGRAGRVPRRPARRRPRGHNVDVFEELARLPEPLPLGDPSAPVPDLLAAPTDTFTDDRFLSGPLRGRARQRSARGHRRAGRRAGPARFPPPPPSPWPRDAPPIDVAMRQGSDRWDLGGAPGSIELRAHRRPDVGHDRLAAAHPARRRAGRADRLLGGHRRLGPGRRTRDRRRTGTDDAPGPTTHPGPKTHSAATTRGSPR